MRIYGRQSDGTIIEAEAAEIRTAAHRILHGDSLKAIARDLTERQVPRVMGSSWQPVQVKRMLTHPRVAGLIPDRGGELQPVEEPILEQDTWEKLCGVLLDPARAKFHAKNDTVSLLTGLVRCSLCDGQMWSNDEYRETTGKVRGAIYKCGVCHKQSIRAEIVEGEVSARILARLTDVTWRDALGDRIAGLQEIRDEETIAAYRDRLAALGVRFANLELDETLVVAAQAQLQANLSEAEARQRLRDTLATIPKTVAENAVLAWWGNLPEAGCRDVCAALLERVTITPAKVAVGSRVTCTWV